MASNHVVPTITRTALTRSNLRSATHTHRLLTQQRRAASFISLRNADGSLNKIALSIGSGIGLIGAIYGIGSLTYSRTPAADRQEQDREIEEWLSKLSPDAKQQMEALKGKMVEKFARSKDETARSDEQDAVEDAYRKELHLFMTRQKQKGVGV